MHVSCYIHPRGPNFHPFRSTISLYWVMRQFSEKCTKWPRHVQGQKYQHACYIHPQGLNFHPFHSTMSRFWVVTQKPNFRESAPNIPKWPWHAQSHKYQHACYIHPRGPNFCLFCSMLFLSYGPIFGKVHRMTPNDLDMFKVKNTNMHVTYTPEAQIFVRFALRWAVFELRPYFRKSAPNDPKWPWHVQGQKYQHACYIHPWAQIFVRFALRWAVFELRANFRKSAPNDPKWPWHVQGQKYQHACYIHPRGPNFRPFRSTMSRFQGNWDFWIPHWLQCKNLIISNS